MSGDAINTASRIQSVAPEMGVAVGLATYEATAAGVRLRGTRPRQPEGEGGAGQGLPGEGSTRSVRHRPDPRTHDTPFVGREIDLALLKGIFDKTVASSSVQLVTVSG